MELIIACGALTLAALLYVFWITPEPVRIPTPEEREREYFEEKRRVLYDNLRDLHLEYRMGKLSDQDYEQMKGTYQAEMTALLAQMETKSEFSPRVVARGEETPPGRCRRCGKDNPVENRFCGACGAELPKGEAIQ